MSSLEAAWTLLSDRGPSPKAKRRPQLYCLIYSALTYCTRYYVDRSTVNQTVSLSVKSADCYLGPRRVCAGNWETYSVLPQVVWGVCTALHERGTISIT